MKVVYLSRVFFTDCDFPLIKELQKNNVDVRYYLPLYWKFQKGSLLEFERPIKKWGVYKASHLPEMNAYKECVDLERLYLICNITGKWYCPLRFILHLYVIIHILLQHADIFHYTWQLSTFERILLYLPFRKKIMTVHDPVQHTGLKDFDRKESIRLKCFNKTDIFLLLNEKNVDEFALKYGIRKESIYLTHLGAYNAIAHINESSQFSSPQPYILFFGQITPHKGLEYLLEAMMRVHEECPDLKLLIAGSGNIYFNCTHFTNLEYIIWENRYVGIKELINLVKNSSFVVCPYKDATQSGVVQTALTLNVPVIATNVGALPMVVEDGVYGSIVPPCDSNSLACEICRLIKKPEILLKMRRNIKEKWLPSMSWSPIAEEYIHLYTNLG